MKLKPQPRPTPIRRSSGGRAGRGAVRRGAGRSQNKMARRPGVPLRRRVGARMPSLARVGAVISALAGGAALVALAGGPWLRVDAVAWDGGSHTPESAMEEALDGARGRPILAVDTAALRARLEDLPSVTAATVSASLTGTITASVTEHTPAFVWETSRARLLGAADGTLFAVLDDDEAPTDQTGPVTHVTDDRFEGRLLAVGDRIPDALRRTAAALTELDPAALGSNAGRLSVRLDDDHGFVLMSPDSEWEVAFGVFGLDPRETLAAAEARLERQVTAVRTLFASHSESEIGWVDVRNPGKVYFRGKG